MLIYNLHCCANVDTQFGGTKNKSTTSTSKEGGNKTAGLSFLPVRLKIFTKDNLSHWTVVVMCCHTH